SEQSETAVASATVRGPAPALGGTAEAVTVEVATPANGPRGICHAKPVLTPLPDIAEHVMESPRIWRLLADCVRSFVRIAMMPRNILRWTMPRLRDSRPAGVFPFRFRRQPVFPTVREHSGFTVEFGELLTVFISLVPAHRIDRCSLNFLMVRRIRACDRLIL